MSEEKKNAAAPAGEKPKEIRREDELEEEKKEPEVLHLKTKPVPCIITLMGGLAASVTTFLLHYPLKNSLIVILVAMVVFLIIGDVVKGLLDRIEIIVPEEPAPEEEASEEAPEENETGQ